MRIAMYSRNKYPCEKRANMFARDIFSILLCMTLWAIPSYAAMNAMVDDELQEVTGTGFANFTLENGVVSASFNILANVYAQMDSLKMGYYNNGTSLGWDQDWTGVSFGSATTDLVVKGLYIEADFTNISDPATRALQSIKVGTPNMTGPITATFNSFSGSITDPTNATLVNGSRLDLGTTTINSTNSAFSASLNVSGLQKGWWITWTNATIQTP